MENQDTRTFKIYPNIEMKPVRFKNCRRNRYPDQGGGDPLHT